MNHKYIDNNSDKLIIIFLSAPDCKDKISDEDYNLIKKNYLEFYEVMKRNNYFGANILWIPDVFSEGGGQYCSDYEISIFDYLKSFIENFIEINGFFSENVYTLGSARGGFASLLYGNACKNISNIISFIPQSNIKNHNIQELNFSFKEIEGLKSFEKNRVLFLTKPYYNDDEYNFYQNDEKVWIIEGKLEYYSEILEEILKKYFEKTNIKNKKSLIKDYSKKYELLDKKYSIEKGSVSNFKNLRKEDGLHLAPGKYFVEINLNETDRLMILRYNLEGERIGEYRLGNSKKFTLEISEEELIWPTILRTDFGVSYILERFYIFKVEKTQFSYTHEVDKLILEKKEKIISNGNLIIFDKIFSIEELPDLKNEEINKEFFLKLNKGEVFIDDIGRSELLEFRSLLWCKSLKDICLGIQFLKLYKREILDEYCFGRGRANILLDYINDLKIKDVRYYNAAITIINNDINKMLKRKKTYYNHDIMVYKTFFTLLSHKNIYILKNLMKEEIKNLFLISYEELSSLIINEYGLLVENTPSYNIMVPNWMREIKTNERINLNLKTRSFFNIKNQDYFFTFGDEDYKDNTFFIEKVEYTPQNKVVSIGQFLKYESEKMQLIAKAYTLSTAHQHQDDLSFQLAWDGELIFIDLGKFKYEYQDERRKFIISRLAHNTISINNKCCSQEKYYKVKYLSNRFNDKYYNNYFKPEYRDSSFIMYDDKYGYNMTREFRNIKSNCFEIYDLVKDLNEGVESIEYRFNIASEFKIEKKNDKVYIFNKTIEVELYIQSELEFYIEEINAYKKNSIVDGCKQLVFRYSVVPNDKQKLVKWKIVINES